MEVLYAVLIPLGILLALAVVFATLLAVLGTKLAVKTDEREELVLSKLSGANCGGCGRAGCADFAKALVEGKVELSDCPSTSKENKQEIANILGTTVAGGDTKIIVACCGGNEAIDKYEYMGYGDCRSMELLAGGRKVCEWGCLGMGACTDACAYHAIEVDDSGYAKIDHEKCTKCGRCIVQCPKNIVKRIPADAKVYLACSNHIRGKEVKACCARGCIGCGLCAKNCPEGAITMDNFKPIINYEICTGCLKCVEKCPSKCLKTF